MQEGYQTNTGRDYFEQIEGNIIVLSSDVREEQHIRPEIGHIPLQRPPRPEPFIGRESELSQLLQELRPGQIISLYGPAGIGKSSLASEALWRLTPENTPPEQFPDGIIFHDFHREPQHIKALEHIVLSFNEKPPSNPLKTAKRVLSEKKALLFLNGSDNADSLADLLPILGHCGVILTSQEPNSEATTRQEVAPLSEQNSLSLLQYWSKDRSPDLVAEKHLCELLGGLALPIRLAGQYLAEAEEGAGAYAYVKYVNWLEKQAIEAFSHGKHREDNTTIVVKHSIQQLSEDAQKILGVAGILAFSSFTQETVAETLPNVELDQSFNELIHYGLLVLLENRYRFSHALLQNYAQNSISIEVDALKRLASYYAETAQEKQLLHDNDWFEREYIHYLQVLNVCQGRKEWQSVKELVSAIGGYLESRLLWADRRMTLEMGIKAIQALGDLHSESLFLSSLANVYNFLGQLSEAVEYFQRALRISQQLKDQQTEGILSNNLGEAYRELGQTEQAKQYFERTLEISRNLGKRRDEGLALGNLGAVCHDLKQVDEAVDYYRQALDISREVNDQRSELIWLGNLGTACQDSRDVSEAIQYYEQALKIARTLGESHTEAIQLMNLGLSAYSQRQLTKALEYYNRAQIIQERQGATADLANIYSRQGSVYRLQGKLKEALRHHEQARDIQEQLGLKAALARTYNNIGIVYDVQKQFTEALGYYEQACEIQQGLNLETDLAASYNNIGLVYSYQGQFDEALSYYTQAAKIQERLQLESDLARSDNNIGIVYFSLGQYEEALLYYEKAIAIRRALNLGQELAMSLNNIGIIQYVQKKYTEALSSYEEAKVIQERLNSEVDLAVTLNNIGGVYEAQEQLPQALSCYERAKELQEQQDLKTDLVMSLNHIGGIYQAQNSYEKALKSYEQALEIQRRLGDGKNLGICLHNIGTVYYARQQYSEALRHYKEASEVQERLGLEDALATTYTNISSVYRAQQQQTDSMPISDYETDHSTAENRLVRSPQLISIQVEQSYDENIIFKTIEFKPEYHDAGMSILNYFGTIIRQKYKDMKVGITIKQEGLNVIMIIETPEGKREIIEETLQDYGLVVKGEKTPESLLSDPFEVMQLKQKLERVNMDYEHAKELWRLAEKQYDKRIESLEEDVEWLRKHVGDVLQKAGTTIQSSQIASLGDGTKIDDGVHFTESVEK